MWQKIKNFALCAVCFALIILFLFKPENTALGALKGLSICAQIIIPSLFIFAVLGIFLISSNCLKELGNILSPLTKIIFGLNGNLFLVFLISLIGGYPVGAKLLDNLAKNNEIDEKSANIMLCYCVNAGPAFIVLAIGEKVFFSRTLGFILLISHILSSLLFALFLRSKLTLSSEKFNINKQNLGDAFVNSVTDAAQSIINICAFVVLFSVISEISKTIGFQILVPFFEVTTGIITTKNLYFAAFLLGFGGFSIQLQILSVIKNFKVQKLRFFACRLLHGSLSVLITFLIIKILKISLPVISNNRAFSYSLTSLSLCASLSFILSSVVLISALKNKKRFLV